MRPATGGWSARGQRSSQVPPAASSARGHPLPAGLGGCLAPGSGRLPMTPTSGRRIPAAGSRRRRCCPGRFRTAAAGRARSRLDGLLAFSAGSVGVALGERPPSEAWAMRRLSARCSVVRWRSAASGRRRARPPPRWRRPVVPMTRSCSDRCSGAPEARGERPVRRTGPAPSTGGGADRRSSWRGGRARERARAPGRARPRASRRHRRARASLAAAVRPGRPCNRHPAPSPRSPAAPGPSRSSLAVAARAR